MVLVSNTPGIQQILIAKATIVREAKIFNNFTFLLLCYSYNNSSKYLHVSRLLLKWALLQNKFLGKFNQEN
jgi:hypothetical protein